MTGISVDLTGGLGTIGMKTCPAADPIFHAGDHTRDVPHCGWSNTSNPITGTPDDAFGGCLWGGPLADGVSAGRGGASGAALPNRTVPEVSPALAGAVC